MVLLIAIIAGLILTVLRAKFTGRQLRPIDLKFIWLVFLAVIPQLVTFQIPAIGKNIPDAIASIVLISSQVTLLGFAGLNLAQPGVWMLAMGLGANFIAIISNGGWMPISPITVHRILPELPDDFPLVGQRLGLSKDWIYANGDIQFSRLADRFTTPDWMNYHVAFSLGDVLIAIGAILLLWAMSSPPKLETI